MLSFEASKADVHHMARLLVGSVRDDLPRNSSVVVVIVVEVLDTPLHRAMNSGETSDNWMLCHVVASRLLEWAQNVDSRPPNAWLISVAIAPTDSEIAKTTDLSNSEYVFRLMQRRQLCSRGSVVN